MKIIDLTVEHVVVSFSLTNIEIDALSLALSKATISPTSAEETKAADTLSDFAEMLNEMLDRVEQANGCTSKRK